MRMRSDKTIARTVGILFLVQAATGYLVNFVLLAPAISAPPGFLATAAGNALQVRVAVLLGLANGALTVGIAIAAWSVFLRYSQAMALWYLALSVVGFSLLAQENIAILSMLSLSQEYVKATAAHEHLQTMGLVVRSTRHWAPSTRKRSRSCSRRFCRRRTARNSPRGTIRISRTRLRGWRASMAGLSC